jgi:hypothetical protein
MDVASITIAKKERYVNKKRGRAEPLLIAGLSHVLCDRPAGCPGCRAVLQNQINFEPG